MTISDFMLGLLDLVFFPFDKVDNVVIIIPFAVMFFVVAFSIIRRLVRSF